MQSLLGALIALVFIKLVRGANVNILDQHDEPVSSIVEQVCWHTSGTGKQISKISTVAHIANHLSSLPADHKLAACSKLYLNSVNELASLVSISNNNVCSQEKINAIQQFHRNYILKGSQRTGKTPKVLATFFMHYVNLVSQICAKETETFLNSINNSTETNTEQVDELLAELTRRTGISSSSSLQYSDIFLVWSMIDLLPLGKQKKIQNYLFEGEKRVVMAAKSFEAFVKMQEFCLHKVKPLYSYSLLATMKLIDMGYYPSDSSVLYQLNENKQARRFYELTKICEALLPVLVVDQPTGSESDIILLSRSEVEELGIVESHTMSEISSIKECLRCSMVTVDSLDAVTSGDAASIAKGVKSNIKSRKSAIVRLLKIFIKNAKANLSGKLRRLFACETGDEIEDIDENQLDIYQISEEYEEDYSQVLRRKRDIRKLLYTIAYRISRVIDALLYVIWAYVTLFILFPIGLVLDLIQWFTGLRMNYLIYFVMTGFGVFKPRKYP